MNNWKAEYEKATARIADLEKERDSLVNELKLIKLRRQVTPHFLFNSISVAVSLVIQSPATAVKFLRHLAQMYRYLLKYGNEFMVPVEQEMEMVMQYYELMSLRHVDCIKLSISQEAKRLKRHPLPPLSLQGLLENAIKHNVHTEDTPLEVSFYVENQNLVVSNRIMPLKSGTESTHMGLSYINQTMLIFSGREIEIKNDSKQFTVRIPLV